MSFFLGYWVMFRVVLGTRNYIIATFTGILSLYLSESLNECLQASVFQAKFTGILSLLGALRLFTVSAHHPCPTLLSALPNSASRKPTRRGPKKKRVGLPKPVLPLMIS